MIDIIDILSTVNGVKEILLPVLQCRANVIEKDNVKVWREGTKIKIEIKTK